ncbi:hypothetical protein [Brachybacterium timonense]|uniref:hypothetical protein n=1 Tax=Brachybacterium timonense TaxID=2050896 RepID=UPI000D0B678B|nr:hypothetical protein [Brachybacterium timonense]
MTEQTTMTPSVDESQTTYTAYEIDFMLDLRTTDAGEITREQIGLRRAPEEAREYVTAAVTSGLHARGKVAYSEDGQWLLGEEAQIIATALTAADRWLGIALAQGDAMRMAFIVKANQAVLMLTQDDLDSFAITALPDPSQVPVAIAGVCSAFLAEGKERTVSLRRTDASAPQDAVPLMFHVEEGGSWKVGHLPLDDDGVLTVSDLDRDGLEAAIAALWEQGASQAPAV